MPTTLSHALSPLAGAPFMMVAHCTMPALTTRTARAGPIYSTSIYHRHRIGRSRRFPGTTTSKRPIRLEEKRGTNGAAFYSTSTEDYGEECPSTHIDCSI